MNPHIYPQDDYEGWSGALTTTITPTSSTADPDYVRPKYGCRVNNKIKSVDLVDALDKSLPHLRNFRENGRYTRKAYKILLSKFCRAADLPDYPKNRPSLVWSPKLESRASYRPTEEKKTLVMRRPGDLRAFLMIWFLYLEDRNDGFWTRIEEKIDNRMVGVNLKRAKSYCDHLLCGSEPQQVRNLNTRAFVETSEM